MRTVALAGLTAATVVAAALTLSADEPVGTLPAELGRPDGVTLGRPSGVDRVLWTADRTARGDALIDRGQGRRLGLGRRAGNLVVPTPTGVATVDPERGATVGHLTAPRFGATAVGPDGSAIVSAGDELLVLDPGTGRIRDRMRAAAGTLLYDVVGTTTAGIVTAGVRPAEEGEQQRVLEHLTADGAGSWSRPVPGRTRSIVADDDLVVVVAGSRVVALDARDGRRRWATPGLTVTEDVRLTSDLVVVAVGAEVVALRRDTGEVAWRRGRAAGGVAPRLVGGDEDVVVLGVEGRRLELVDAAGEVRASLVPDVDTPAGATLTVTPAGRSLVLSSRFGLAVVEESGTLRWETDDVTVEVVEVGVDGEWLATVDAEGSTTLRRLGDGEVVWRSPGTWPWHAGELSAPVVDGVAFVDDGAGIELATGRRRPDATRPEWLAEVDGTLVAGSFGGFGVAATDGDGPPRQSLDRPDGRRGSAVGALDDGILVLDPEGRLRIVDPLDGDEVRTGAVLRPAGGDVPLGELGRAAGTLAGRPVLLREFPPTGSDAVLGLELTAVDPATLEPVWSVPWPVPSLDFRSDGTELVGLTGSGWTRVAAGDGTVTDVELDELAAPEVLYDGTLFGRSGAGSALVAWDPATGEERWRTALAGVATHGPVGAGDRLVVGLTSGEVVVLDLDGAVLDRRALAEAPIVDVDVADGVTLVTTSDAVTAFAGPDAALPDPADDEVDPFR